MLHLDCPHNNTKSSPSQFLWPVQWHRNQTDHCLCSWHLCKISETSIILCEYIYICVCVCVCCQTPVCVCCVCVHLICVKECVHALGYHRSGTLSVH